jgi:hypothetical protein
MDVIAVLPAIFTIVGALLGLGAAVFVTYRQARREDASQYRKASDLQSIELSSPRKQPMVQLDLATLWAITQERIDFYHDIAIKQSRRSFFGSQVAMYVGFMCIIGLGIAASVAQSATAAIAAGVAAVAGGAIKWIHKQDIPKISV